MMKEATILVWITFKSVLWTDQYWAMRCHALLKETSRKPEICQFCVNYWHGPIHHGLATPFLSYRVTLIACKTRDFIRDLIMVQTRPSPPMLGFVYKVLARFNCAIFNSHITWRKNFLMFVLPLLRHVFFWVIIILHRLYWGLVQLK